MRRTLPMATTKGWRLVGRTLAGAFVARHCWRWRRTGVFRLRKMKGSENAVADESLVSLLCR